MVIEGVRLLIKHVEHSLDFFFVNDFEPFFYLGILMMNHRLVFLFGLAFRFGMLVFDFFRKKMANKVIDGNLIKFVIRNVIGVFSQDDFNDFHREQDFLDQ